MVWYGMVWYGMVWYGMVWYGMVWCGIEWDILWCHWRGVLCHVTAYCFV
jgi:chloride channel 2